MDNRKEPINIDPLSREHRRQLETDSCISSHVLKRAYIFSGSQEEISQIFGVKRSGIVFPYFGLNGEPLAVARVRFDDPIIDKDGREQRYRQPKNSDLSCYFLPDETAKILDPNVPLVITEGEKKGLSLASLESIANMAVVAIPGCWNFKKKGERSLSAIWQQIPLHGRHVNMVFDTDYFTNPNVTKAGDQFLKLLFEAGATINIIDLRAQEEMRKVGADDFIASFGSEKLNQRILSPVWTLKKQAMEGDDIEGTDECIRRTLENLIILPSIGIESLLQQIKSKTKISLATLREMFTETLDRWKALRPGASGRVPTKLVLIDKRNPTRQVLSHIAKTLVEDGRFFNFGEELLMIDNGKRVLVTPQTMPGVMSDLGVEFATKGRECLNFYTMPPNLAQIVCQSRNSLRAGLKDIVLFTDHPTYDSDWKLIPPGYHENERIFYIGDEINPKRGMTAINAAIQDFAFKNEASRANFIAMMITAILRNRYRGDRPFAAVTANKPQIGKTLASKVISIIAEGRFPQTMSFIRNQEEMEKQIAARIILGDSLIIDNVKCPYPIDSPPLERLVTDDPVSYRYLGMTKTISRPNTIIAFVTMNEAKFCRDLITRALPIELFHDEAENPSSRRFARDDLAHFVLQNRKDIISEIFGLIEVWKESGYPLCDKNSRFKMWAKEIGGILAANGIAGFLDNYESAASTYDRTSHDLATMFEGYVGKPVTAAELVLACEDLRIFPDILGTKKAPTSLSHVIGKHIGKALQLPNRHDTIIIRLGKPDRTGTKTYIADVQEKAPLACTLLNSAGTNMDHGSQGPGTLSNGSNKGNKKPAGTAWTESGETNQREFLPKQEASGQEPPEVSANPISVHAIHAEEGNHLLSLGKETHGHRQAQDQCIPGPPPGSMHKQKRGSLNGMDWGDTP